MDLIANQVTMILARVVVPTFEKPVKALPILNNVYVSYTH